MRQAPAFLSVLGSMATLLEPTKLEVLSVELDAQDATLVSGSRRGRLRRCLQFGSPGKTPTTSTTPPSRIREQVSLWQSPRSLSLNTPAFSNEQPRRYELHVRPRLVRPARR